MYNVSHDVMSEALLFPPLLRPTQPSFAFAVGDRRTLRITHIVGPRFHATKQTIFFIYIYTKY